MIFELLLKNIDFLKSLFDLKVIDLPTETVCEEETIQKTMRFDKSIKVHKLSP